MAQQDMAKDTITADESGRNGGLAANRGDRLRRMVPLLLLVAGLIAFLLMGGGHYLSYDALVRNHDMLARWVAANHALALLAYVAAYALLVALSVPGATLMTVLGGFLFGTLTGGLTAAAGATLGALLIFLAARTALADFFQARVGGWVRRLEAGFRANAFNYLITLRLIPVVPFWLLNIVPALLGVPTRAFVLATGLGVIPCALVYASVGNGLDEALAAGTQLDLNIIFRPAILLPLIGLSLFALLPVAVRYWRARHP